MWERGLKSIPATIVVTVPNVVPLVGTWIEIPDNCIFDIEFEVVPLVGTWIEINDIANSSMSIGVVPLVGTWIEIA